MRTTGKQCGLAATGDYQPSLRSPWLAAAVMEKYPSYFQDRMNELLNAPWPG
ncbi:hypothetical protein [Thiolapillus sp.]|uniref:hypothetical protein n=1 Tax=Thiolapillus sp. TaxID=2017437 RepID=UPI003AF75150